MLLSRPRRIRQSPAVRALVQETHVKKSQLIYPLFVKENGPNEPIGSLPGIDRYSLEGLLKEVERALNLGIETVALFPVISAEKKDPWGKEALNPEGIGIKAIRKLKEAFPALCVISDVALDPFTSHGHDGVVNENMQIVNDESVAILSQMALLQAQAGADMVAPSDMMDGRVRKIRETLESHGYTEVAIHAYAAKYASCFYAPFRTALGSTLAFGDKKSYQLNPANRREAVWEALLDEKEGADILMVKPALLYLDVIAKIREATSLPISAFQVSGEYAMVMAAQERGWLCAEEALLESLLCIKRAGADMIFTYGATKVAPFL